MWDSRQALIIAAGVFRGLPRHRPPLPPDLVRFGFMPELIERIGSLLRLDPLAPALLSRVLRAGLRDEVAAYAALGYELRITEEACGRVARAVVAGSLHAGSRQAVSLLASAAHA